MGQAPLYNCSNGSNYVVDCVDGYLIDFYGSSALWFAIVEILFNTFIALSDLIFIFVFFSSSALRSNPPNFLLVGLVLADTFHYTSLGAGAISLLVGYITQPTAHTLSCKIIGLVVVSTGACSYGFPGLIAAQRYYKISYLPTNNTRFSIAQMIFGDKRLISLMIIWWIIAISANLPLIIFFDEFGEDPDGYCGVKPFREALPFAMYFLSVMLVFCLSYSFMGIYYFRLGRFLKTLRKTESNKESINSTRSLMLMTKIIVIIPTFAMTPALLLSSGQWILYGHVPMWMNRFISSFYFIPASITPWVAIYTLKPFRHQFLKLYFSIKHRFTGKVSTVFTESRIGRVSD